MKLHPLTFLVWILFLGCKPSTPQLNRWEPYDETSELISNAEHPISRMQYKRIQSKHTDRNSFFTPFQKDLVEFTQTDYEILKPLILEQDIPSIQKQVQQGHLTY